MYKKITLLAFIVFVTNTKAQTPYVAIPDSNFVHYLKTIVPAAFKGDSLNKNSTLVTTITHTISCGGYGISNLNGVQYFTSLTDLDCSFNNLTSLPPLPNSLQLLGCGHNNISCFPTFPNSLTSYIFDPNPYSCFPNYFTAMDSALLATPLCASGNTYSCAVAASCAPAANFFLNQQPAPHTWYAYPAFSANTTSARWYWGDGSSTTGLHPSHTYSVAGTYTICVAVYSACGDSSVFCQNNDTTAVYINVLTRATTGIAQVTGSNKEVTVYPNPTNGVLNIEGLMLNETAIVTITDMLGNTIYHSTFITQHNTINVSDLNAGVYIISIETKEGTVIKKIIKQ